MFLVKLIWLSQNECIFKERLLQKKHMKSCAATGDSAVDCVEGKDIVSYVNSSFQSFVSAL